jgi:Ca2+-dependent lipid-binding protein
MKNSIHKKLKTRIRHDIKSELFDLSNLLKILLRIFLYSFLFWFLGRYGFSFLWLILLACLETLERHCHLLRLERIHFFQELTKDFRPTIEKRLTEFPSWISYPDYDRCEWLNKLVEQMWPTISTYVENVVKNTIEPEIKKQISGLSFERIDLGDFPPRLGGIKIYTDNIRSDEIILDTELFYGGDMHIKMKYHSFKAGIKSLYLHGELRLVFKSIVSKIPFIGALELFFLRTPTIDFDLTDIANIIEIPGLHRLLMLSLERILQTLIVIPNRLIIAFMNEIDINQLKFPKPDGVLRIDILEAKNLPKYDHSLLLTKNFVDAYVTISIGQYKFKTHIHKSNNPKWYETFEVPIEESNTQQLQVRKSNEFSSFSDIIKI